MRKAKGCERLGSALGMIALASGIAFLLYVRIWAQGARGTGDVPEARQAMGINLPAYRMDSPPGTPIPIDDQIVDDLNALGVKWMRVEMRARGNPPTIPIADYHTVLDRLAARNVQTLGLLDYTTVPWPRPSWSTTEFREEFVHTASLLAAEFKEDVDHWEIWNEQDIGYGPGRLGGDTYMSPEDYAYLLGGDPAADPVSFPWAHLGVYQAIKGADPDATVLLGGLSNAWKASDGAGAGNYLLELYEQLSGLGYSTGAWPFDVVAVHPYYGRNPDPAVYLFSDGFYILRSNIWSVMNEYGDGGKRIWITEIGWNTNQTQWVCMPPFVSELDQAAYLTESWDIFLTVPTGGGGVLVDRVFWYQYQDTGVWVDPEQCPVATATPASFQAPESFRRVRPPRVTPTPSPGQRMDAPVVIDSWWGLVHGDYVPKPSYDAYRDYQLPDYLRVYLPVILSDTTFP